METNKAVPARAVRVNKDATWLDVPRIMSSVGARELDFDRYSETWSVKILVMLADSMHQPVPADHHGRSHP